MRVLIVKLSSLGDVVHALPALHDLHAARPGVTVDWVVEPAFAPLLHRVPGVAQVIECSLRRWRKAWWTQPVRAEWRAFRQRLQARSYEAIIDLQGLTKSALVARLARGTRYGLGHRTDGSSWERPARWLVDHPIDVPRHSHAVDRSRALVAQVVGVPACSPVCFGLEPAHTEAPAGAAPLMVFVHGTSRDDKLWPEADWIGLGQRLAGNGWRIAMPHAGPVERARADRIATAVGDACSVWPAMRLDELVDTMAGAQAVIGVDSGLSHIAVALGLPHLQLYNVPTAWRTGPQPAHGHRHQRSIQAQAGEPAPRLDAVWCAWLEVHAAAPART